MLTYEEILKPLGMRNSYILESRNERSGSQELIMQLIYMTFLLFVYGFKAQINFT